MNKLAAAFALLLLFAVETPAQTSWQKVSLGISLGSSVPSITGANELVLGTVTGDPLYKAVRSIDSGKTWLTPPLTVLAPARLKSLSFAFAYGVRGDSIMTTNSQGTTWSVARPALTALLADVHFINSTQAWAVGTSLANDTPVVAVTTDGWATPPSRSVLPADSTRMLSIQFVNTSTGFALGRSTKSIDSNAAVFFRTTDGGSTWLKRGSLPDTCAAVPFLAADFIDATTGWAIQTCGTTAKVYQTLNGAQSWTLQYNRPVSSFLAVDGVNPLNVWVAGTSGISNGLIVRTSDGGNTWNPETLPPSGIIRSLSMLSTTHGYASGDAVSGAGGTVLVFSSISTGVSDGPANRPKSFELFQNYPNPFNGETRIAFTLLKNQPVTLTVYNILGQPVRTLLNGARPAGKTEVSWDGRDERGFSVSSGIYFYKLSTADEKQVRKMVLLK